MTGKRERRLIVGAGGVIVLAAFAVWLVAFSSVFGVGTVRVQGVHALTAAQVREAAHIAEGTPLLRLDRAAVTRRVERLPGVAHADVRTSFPSTVIIDVRERVPVGYLQDGGSYRLVDVTGTEYRTVSAQPDHLPELIVPGGSSNAPTVAAVAQVAASLPPGLLAQVASIQALAPTAVTVLLTDQRVIHWGSADHNADKARVLPALLQTSATQIDVSDPDQPYTR